MKKFAAIALIMLGIGIIGVILAFDMKDIRTLGTEPVLIEKTIESTSVRSLSVESSNIDMEIIRGTSEDIKVRIDGYASKKYLDRFQLEAETEGDTAVIHASYKDTFFVGINFVNVDLIVELPDRLWDKVELVSSHDTIEVEELKATLADLQTGSGNLEIDQLQAETAKLQTSSGNIQMEELTSKLASITIKSGNAEVEGYAVEQLTVEATSGNISLNDGTGRIEGKTDSGNIRVELEELLQDITLKTGSGNARIEVDNEPKSAAISFRTNSGTRNIDWETLNAVNDNEEVLNGTIGSGQIKVDVETRSGNLKLGKND